VSERYEGKFENEWACISRVEGELDRRFFFEFKSRGVWGGKMKAVPKKEEWILGHGGGICYEFSWSLKVRDIIYLCVGKEHGSVLGKLAYRWIE